MKKHRGFTLVELLIVLAIIGAIAAAIVGVSNANLEAAKKQACLGEMSTPLAYYSSWLATVRPDNPLGNRVECRLYKVAAEAWNSQCDDVMTALTVPEACPN